MKFKIYFFLLLSCAWLFSQSPQHADEIRINNDLKLLHLTDSIYVHISWFSSKDFGRFSSNGMLIIKKGQALMIDTPMNIEMTEQLYNFVRDSMHVAITKFIAGHYHEDCIGGLAFLNNKGVETIANYLTVDKCKELSLPLPEKSFVDSLKFDFNGESVECLYPGAGHTIDNIAVWLPGKAILFGGCMIKEKNSKGLGFTGDAVVGEWDNSLRRLFHKYKNIKMVIPGHGAIGHSGLITHTIELVQKEKNK